MYICVAVSQNSPQIIPFVLNLFYLHKMYIHLFYLIYDNDQEALITAHKKMKTRAYLVQNSTFPLINQAIVQLKT